jgi:hypothetical protein
MNGSTSSWGCVGILGCALALSVGCKEVTATPESVEFTLRVVGRGNPEPIEGVQFCQLDIVNCAETDSDGLATIRLPPNTDTGWTLVKEGYLPIVTPVHLDGDSGFSFTLDTDQEMTSLAQTSGFIYPYRDWGDVTITLGAGNTFVCVEFELANAVGQRFCTDEEGVPDSTLDATTCSWGRCSFMEVAPGIREIDFGGTAEACSLGWAWPGNHQDQIRVPVREGFRTYATIDCAVPDGLELCP